MALSALEQAYLDYTMSSGAGSSNVYRGTALTGGSYGSVAGGKKRDGKKENAGQGSSGESASFTPGGIPVKEGMLPFDPKSYQDQYSVNRDGGPHVYYNDFYFKDGRKVPCNGWMGWEYPEPGEVVKLPACPTDQPANKKPPLVSYYDFP